MREMIFVTFTELILFNFLKIKITRLSCKLSILSKNRVIRLSSEHSTRRENIYHRR